MMVRLPDKCWIRFVLNKLIDDLKNRKKIVRIFNSLTARCNINSAQQSSECLPHCVATPQRARIRSLLFAHRVIISPYEFKSFSGSLVKRFSHDLAGCQLSRHSAKFRAQNVDER